MFQETSPATPEKGWEVIRLGSFLKRNVLHLDLYCLWNHRELLKVFEQGNDIISWFSSSNCQLRRVEWRKRNGHGEVSKH